MIWDHLFRSFHLGATRLRAGDLGLKDVNFPKSYAAQFAWPLVRRDGV